jgi:ATP-dependent Clp protease ATP-binding subunit ClpA
MIDLGPMTDKFSEAGQKLVRRAIEVSRSRDHNYLGLSHIFAAMADIESDLFVETMQAVGIDPDSVASLLEEELANSPVHVGRKIAIPDPTRDLFNRALRRARAQGRKQIESYDFFATLFTDPNGTPAEILRRLGVDVAGGLSIIGSGGTGQARGMGATAFEGAISRIRFGGDCRWGSGT